MKAVILAAGNGKRMLPLSRFIPKPMVQVHGKPLLEHIINILPDKVDEIFLITGHLEDKIINHFENTFRTAGVREIKINYIHQPIPNGTWKTVKLAEKYLPQGESFLLIYADDMHGKVGLENLVQHKNAILVAPHENPKKFGVVEHDENNFLVEIQEKPENPKTNLVATGVYVLDPKIFSYPDPTPVNCEYYITDVFNEYLKNEKIKVVEATAWLPVGTPEDVIAAHNHDIFEQSVISDML